MAALMSRAARAASVTIQRLSVIRWRRGQAFLRGRSRLSSAKRDAFHSFVAKLR